MAMKPCGQVLEQQGELAGAHSAYREALTAAKSSSEGVGAQHQFLSAAEEAACSLGLARTAVLCGDAGLGAALAAASEDQAVWLECAYLLEATQQLQASGRCCRPIKRGYCCHTSWWDEGATTWRSVAACAGLIAELLQLYTGVCVHPGIQAAAELYERAGQAGKAAALYLQAQQLDQCARLVADGACPELQLPFAHALEGAHLCKPFLSQQWRLLLCTPS